MKVHCFIQFSLLPTYLIAMVTNKVLINHSGLTDSLSNMATVSLASMRYDLGESRIACSVFVQCTHFYLVSFDWLNYKMECCGLLK